MKISRIYQYYNELHEASQVSGSSNETTLRRYFENLLEDFAKDRRLRLIAEKAPPNGKSQMER